MIVDFHARLSGGDPAQLLAAMDACGIGRTVVCAGGLVDLDTLSRQVASGGRTEARADNHTVRRACALSGGRLLPFFFADPLRDVDTYRRLAQDFRGLEISPAVHGVGLDHPGVRALVEIAAAARHPVYVVCLARDGARAADLVALAEAYPRVDFVFGHCGGSGLDADGLARIAPLPNILAETSGAWTAIARLAVRRLGAARVLFGTEFPLQDPRVEVVKLDALGLDPAQLRQVAAGNAHRLLREEFAWSQP